MTRGDAAEETVAGGKLHGARDGARQFSASAGRWLNGVCHRSSPGWATAGLRKCSLPAMGRVGTQLRHCRLSTASQYTELLSLQQRLRGQQRNISDVIAVLRHAGPARVRPAGRRTGARTRLLHHRRTAVGRRMSDIANTLTSQHADMHGPCSLRNTTTLPTCWARELLSFFPHD